MTHIYRYNTLIVVTFSSIRDENLRRDATTLCNNNYNKSYNNNNSFWDNNNNNQNNNIVYNNTNETCQIRIWMITSISR